MAEPADVTASFAAILDEHCNIDLLKLGCIDDKDRRGQTLTPTERAAHDAVLADPMAVRILTAAALRYQKYCEQQVRDCGGTVYRRRIRARDGHTSYRVERFPTSAERLPSRSRPRARGAGRPRAVARSSSRGGDSGDTSDDPEPGPSSGRRLNSRADIDRWLVERKAALDRVVAWWSE